jgi:hypothetical protein
MATQYCWEYGSRAQHNTAQDYGTTGDETANGEPRSTSEDRACLSGLTEVSLTRWTRRGHASMAPNVRRYRFLPHRPQPRPRL